MKKIYSVALLILFILPFLVHGQASLPLSRTAWGSNPTGWTSNNVTQRTSTFACSGNDGGSLQAAGSYYRVNFNSSPDQLSFNLKGSNPTTGSFKVQESPDAITWTDVLSFSSVTGSACSLQTKTLLSTSRYVQFIYIIKTAGNIDIDDVSISALVSNTITTGAGNYGPFCNNIANSITLPFTQTGSFTGQFNIQYSSASGVFPTDATSQLLTNLSSTATSVTANIPIGFTAGTGYRLRIVNNTPVYYTSGTNGSNIFIYAQPTVAAIGGGQASVCAGYATSAFTNATSGGTWGITNGSPGSATITSGGVVTGTVAGTVTVTYTVTNGTCTNTATKPLTIDASPVNPGGTISGTTPACTSTSLTFSGAAVNIYWQTISNGTSTSNATTTPLNIIASGSYYVRAYNGTCWSAGQTGPYNVVINTPTAITVDPSNASVFAPSTATFSVTATNAVSYQWQVNTGSGFNNISGATSASYTTPSTTVAMSGYQYQVIVSGGACGSIISAPATLTVNTTASMWSNPITGTNPNSSNPYTTGQVLDANLTVSGIGRGSGIAGNVANDRYNADSWNTSTIDLTAYFYFTLTPAAGYKIDFTNFVYTGEASGTGPTNFAIRSSIDGFTANLATPGKTGTTLSLTGAAFQSVTSAITFRIYAWGASASGGTYSINDFTFNGTVSTSCPATKLIFTNTFTNVNQDEVIPAFPVSIACTDNTKITSCSSGTIKLTSTGCGLNGTLTKNVVNGVATFDDIYFGRSVQNNVTITATYTGTCGTYSDAVSNTFTVNLGGGAPIITTLKNENFSGSSPAWAYTIGTPTYTNVGTEGGTDVTGIKTFSGNNVMAKSYSQDNSSAKKEQGSTNTVTFDNVTGLATYNSVKFSFQIGSVPTGSIGTGAGADNGEYMYIECSLNGGTWRRLLTNNGYSDHAFNLSAASPVSLPYNANVIYQSGDNLWNQSAFEVTLPSGTTDFMFRMVANDNRSNENWVIDNIKLEGTTYGAATQKPLPVASASDIYSCPGSNNTISVGVNNAIGTLTYVWTPNTNISSTTISNPVVNPATTTTYMVTATDADKCIATASVLVTVPSGTDGSWTGLVSKDYFNCLNWANGTVPVAATNVTINNTPNSVEIDATSTFANSFGSTADANNFTLNNNNIDFILGTEKLNILNLTITNSAHIGMMSGGTVNLTGVWTNTVGAAGFTSGIGTINYTGSGAQTIAPENYYNLTSSSTGSRTIPGAGIVGISNIFNIGTNAFTLASGSTVDFNGAVAQSVPAFDYYNLNLSNNDLKTIAGNTSVSGTLKLTGAASLAISSRFLTLKSTAAGTAMVAPVTTTATMPISYGAGKFVVERYYPGRRAWRLITAPISTTRTIYNEWQIGGAPATSYPSSGTHITSPNSADFGNGLDSSIHYSMKKFDQATGALVNVTNTNVPISGNLQQPNVPDNIGYFMFVRGDRTPTLLKAYPVTNYNITTLRDTGVLQIGTKTFGPVSNGSFMLVGNPYASPVNFGNLGFTNVAKKFWAWDPRLNSNLGSYVYVDGLSGTYIVVPKPSDSSSGQNQYIQSSQAFFVQASSTGAGTVAFNETTKAITDNNTVFRPVQSADDTVSYESLRSNLYLNEGDTAILADGVYNQFNDSFSPGIDDFDALKFTNILENFGIVKNGKTLTLERSPLVTDRDTIFFKLWNTTARNYQFRFSSVGMNHPGLEGFLEDSFIKTSTPVDLNGYTNINFSVTGDAASKATNRFRIVFKQSAAGPLPVTFTTVKAYQQNNSINVEWNVSNEINTKEYEVERSADGRAFTAAAVVTATGNNNSDINYAWPDEEVAAGTYYYRIRSISNSGEVKFSSVVKVTIEKGLPRIFVYPNPVIAGNNIQLHFINQPKGRFGIRLLNKLGQLLAVKQVEISGLDVTEKVPFSKTLSHGTYQLEVTKPDGSKTNIALLY